MRYLVILTLALSTLSPAQPATVARNVSVVFVQPTGEVFTIEEQIATLQSVAGAIHFWETLSPVTTTLRVVSTQLITTTDNVFSADVWYQQYMQQDDNTLNIVVVDNSTSQHPFSNSAWAFAVQNYGLVVGVTYNPFGVDGTAAVLAHEMGHILYNLPDWYVSTPCAEPDIMCYAYGAYQLHTIGCQSLEYLGTPCKRIYVPIIRTRIGLATGL